jgi:hypothetical protein
MGNRPPLNLRTDRQGFVRSRYENAGLEMNDDQINRLIANLREFSGRSAIHPYAGAWMLAAADELALLLERRPAVAHGWRCFHCEATFTDAESAREHFGNSERQGPICEIDAAKFRETEALLARYQEEDTDLHREIYGMQARHATELRREEEKGYARGLTDGLSQRVPGWTIDAHEDGWVIAEPGGRSHIAHDKPMCDETERVLARLCTALAARTDDDAAQVSRVGELECEIAAMKATAEKKDAKSVELGRMLANIIHDQTVAMQSALIEWKFGKGADAGFGWVINTLSGPGHLPDFDAEYGRNAQFWFDSNCAAPNPKCFCGNPSHILWMGQGFCCDAHFDEAKASRDSAPAPPAGAKDQKTGSQAQTSTPCSPPVQDCR